MSSQSFENVTAKWTFFVQQLFFFGQKLAKVAIIKTKSACMQQLLFFPSSPFFLLALSCSPSLFLCQCDFGSYSSPLITYLLTPFHS